MALPIKNQQTSAQFMDVASTGGVAVAASAPEPEPAIEMEMKMA